MEQRFATHLDQLLRDAQVDPALARGLLPRLDRFLDPFVASLRSPEQRTNAQQYVQGLLSQLESKDAESIAYLHDRERQGMQKFIGQADWNHQPLIRELAFQVARELGEEDAVLVFDPSAFPKKGTESVGVARQWCGRLGKVDNCQVGIYLGYVSRREHALVDFRLYLPKEWTRDRARKAKAGVPRGTRFQTRHQLVLSMLEEHQDRLPHRWISGDDELGRSSWFRHELRVRGESYLLAVPSNTLIRDRMVAAPEHQGRGRPRQVPFQRVDRWMANQEESSWTQLEVRAGEKGPIVVEALMCRVQTKREGRVGSGEETLVVFRERQGNGTWKHDYCLSNEGVEIGLSEYARVFKSQHRIEECLQRAKSEAGLGDYQVRSWEGWHHHQVLSLLATWFLTQETRRGKNTDPRDHGSAVAGSAWWPVESSVAGESPGAASASADASVATQRGSESVPLATA